MFFNVQTEPTNDSLISVPYWTDRYENGINLLFKKTNKRISQNVESLPCCRQSQTDACSVFICWSLSTSLFFSFSLTVDSPHAECGQLIAKLHPRGKRPHRWTVAMEPRRPHNCGGRGGESTSLRFSFQQVLSRLRLQCRMLRDWTRVSTLESGNRTWEMEEVLENVLLSSSCCCIYLTRLLILLFFLRFSDSSFPLLSMLVLFLMNYLLTPHCWLQCMSEHL